MHIDITVDQLFEPPGISHDLFCSDPRHLDRGWRCRKIGVYLEAGSESRDDGDVEMEPCLSVRRQYRGSRFRDGEDKGRGGRYGTRDSDHFG